VLDPTTFGALGVRIAATGHPHSSDKRSRRDFVRLARDWGAQRQQWAEGWVECIGEVYRLNRERLHVRGAAPAFAVADAELRDALERMAVWREAELANAEVVGIARQTLKSMATHWAGLVVFLDHPEVPMDNNTAERAQRNPVVGRKNYYGSGAEWSGKLAATMFSIFQTLLLWKLKQLSALTASHPESS